MARPDLIVNPNMLWELLKHIEGFLKLLVIHTEKEILQGDLFSQTFRERRLKVFTAIDYMINVISISIHDQFFYDARKVFGVF